MTSPPRSPSSQRAVAFGPFLLDRPAGRLWRDRAPVALRPKAWEVLGYLVDRPGVLVSAGELFDEIWKGVAVTPQTLMNVVAQLRVALGDDAREPRWLETVRGRGYRFIGALQAPLEQESDATVAEPGADSGPRMQSARAEEEWARPPATLVGRDREIGALTAAWRRTLASGRQVIVVTGEAGIGKTTRQVAPASVRRRPPRRRASGAASSSPSPRSRDAGDDASCAVWTSCSPPIPLAPKSERACERSRRTSKHRAEAPEEHHRR